jgi:hypothetical protein
MKDSCSRSLLAIAVEVESTEAIIKQHIMDAATNGDYAEVVRIVTRWQTMPVADVLVGTSGDTSNKPRPRPLDSGG